MSWIAAIAPEETARALVEAALHARIGDNATALVVDLIALPDADQSDLESAVNALPIIPAPRSGAVIDGYVLGRMLSDGRYSRVFRASQQSDQRAVIIKFPKPATGAEPVLRLAFLREFWIAARLRSPWIAEVIETPLQSRTALYTVMPFYEGETLEQRLLRRPRVTRTEGVAIATKLAKAVATLHRAGVIHRDIKPDNVILQPDGGLKLLDLGVARLPNIEDFPATTVPGTPSYMAPELIDGQPGNEKSDIFALGVTLFRMFTGAYPYGEIEPFSRPRFTRPPASVAAAAPRPAVLAGSGAAAADRGPPRRSFRRRAGMHLRPGTWRTARRPRPAAPPRLDRPRPFALLANGVRDTGSALGTSGDLALGASVRIASQNSKNASAKSTPRLSRQNPGFDSKAGHRSVPSRRLAMPA